MSHPLDNPVWHALTGPHANLALGTGMARQYPRDMAPFSAIARSTAAAYADLARHLPLGLEARLFRPAKEAPPPGWEVVSARPIRQMVGEAADLVIPAPSGEGLTELGSDDVADMTALAATAKPGPFGLRTMTLGRFLGTRSPDGRLLAMAGERFRLRGFVELSAICVHPAVRGRGLGATLTLHLAHAALARGEVPFLHVFNDNPAVALYARLGFRQRAMLWVLWHRPAAP